MIRRLLILPLVCVLLGAMPAPAKQWANALFNDKLVHDFGTVAAGALAEHRFVLENVYQEDIEIGFRGPLDVFDGYEGREAAVFLARTAACARDLREPLARVLLEKSMAQ